ncbi:WXG100 family type VII secretion target [Streptomyces sp. NPDC001941]|uniref:WXG100 family type VII secretion target n=1 Tax=Streptomyces sp. NPDC001941 TaxID=3154659 RepID=UPI0033271FD3
MATPVQRPIQYARPVQGTPVTSDGFQPGDLQGVGDYSYNPEEIEEGVGVMLQGHEAMSARVKSLQANVDTKMTDGWTGESREGFRQTLAVIAQNLEVILEWIRDAGQYLRDAASDAQETDSSHAAMLKNF